MPEFLYLTHFRAIQSYSEKYNPNHSGFEMVAFFQAVGEFLLIFSLSLILGSTLGIATALVFIFFSTSFPQFNMLLI